MLILPAKKDGDRSLLQILTVQVVNRKLLGILVAASGRIHGALGDDDLEKGNGVGLVGAN